MSAKPFKLLLLILLFTGCESKHAFDYNEKIVAIEKSMEPDISRTRGDIFRFMEDQEFDSLVILSAEMETLAANKLKQVEDMPAPSVKEGENFKQASIRYFSYIKRLYTGYKRYGMEKTEDKRELERKRMVETENEATVILDEMKKAQEKFAKANGFRIGEK